MPSANGFLRAETETYFRERRAAQEVGAPSAPEGWEWKFEQKC